MKNFLITFITTAFINSTGYSQAVTKFVYDKNGNQINVQFFGFQSCSPVALPVTLLELNATSENRKVHLSWRTSEEFSSKLFEIEYSVNSRSWDKIGSVLSSTQSNEIKNYFFNHNDPSPGENYYRLKMVDQNETFTYSKIKTVYLDNDVIGIYPNPVSTIVHFETRNFTKVVGVIIFNNVGKQVLAANSDLNNGIKVSHLSQGNYILMLLRSDGELSSHKIIIVR